VGEDDLGSKWEETADDNVRPGKCDVSVEVSWVLVGTGPTDLGLSPYRLFSFSSLYAAMLAGQSGVVLVGNQTVGWVTTKAMGCTIRPRRKPVRRLRSGPTIPQDTNVAALLPENRLDHRPGRLYRIFANEQQSVAVHGICQQTLVGLQLTASIHSDERQLGGNGRHFATRLLDADSQLDGEIRVEAEPHIVGVQRCSRDGDSSQPHSNFCDFPGELLTGADQERHSSPSPGID
jgi:hypothetical protein